MDPTDPTREPQPSANPDRREAPQSNRGLIGVVFALLLVGLAIWLMNRMQLYASLGDCAFTHAPQCRELIDK